ncbi:sulfotransferase family protein [Roseivirga sp.]|uniref:sulfotransferase family protein n=1 Tax=Roseivirga sp. TaxID=1964215 RepID=UPI003B8C983F
MSNILFIGGCERSGTTMLASLLCGSGDCVSAPESQFKSRLLSNDLLSKKDLEYLKSDFRFGLWNDGEFLSHIDLNQVKKYQFLPELLNYKFHDKDYRFFVDHTPTNFYDYHSLKIFYPQAKFLHIIRDGRAVYNSFRSLTWGPKDAIRASEWWLKKVSLGMAPLALGEDVYTVFYEELVRNPEDVLKRICDWLAISFDDNMIKGDNSFLPTYTQVQHSLVGKGVSVNRLDSWKTKLSSKEIKIFQSRAGYLLEILGYQDHSVDYRTSKYSEMSHWIHGWVKAKRMIKKQRSKETEFSKGQ